MYFNPIWFYLNMNNTIYLYVYDNENNKKSIIKYFTIPKKTLTLAVTADFKGRPLAAIIRFINIQERRKSREGEIEREKRDGYTGAVLRQISVGEKDQWVVRE